MTGREVMMSSTAHSRREDAGAIRSRGHWVIREFDAVHDADAVSRIDTSYTSDQVYAVHRSGDVVALAPTSLTVPHSKRAPIDLGGAWTQGRVALLDDRVRGFIAWGFDAWNRRMTIGEFHVDRPYRRRGGGRGLIDAALDWARHSAALTAWIEASSVNHAAIAAYRRLGFEICGFDTTLYRGTPNQGEVAVYMARLIDGDGRPHAG